MCAQKRVVIVVAAVLVVCALLICNTSPIIEATPLRTTTTVTSAKKPTRVTISAPSSAKVKQSFTISSSLTANGAPLSKRIVYLQRLNDNTWTTLTSTVATTGTYFFSRTETVANIYKYRTTYAGSATYASATSQTVIINIKPTPTVTPTAKTTVKPATTTPAPTISAVTSTGNATGLGAVTVVLGQNFTIQLQSNPSTGYYWEPQFDSTALSLTDSVFISDPKPHNLVGVPGSQNFTFQGIKQGTSIITFNNISPSNDTANSVTATVTVTAPTRGKINISYPVKLLNYGQTFGRVACEPGNSAPVLYVPTDGSGTTVYYGCDGTAYTWPPTGASNELKYFVDNGWGITLAPTSEMLKNYPSELATRGPGHTEMDTFKKTYVDLMDANHIKWWLEISLVMDDQSVLTYQTPGYNSTHYIPASGMAKSYEAEFGPALDFIEHNCSTNFQGYTFEQAYTNGVVWLHNRTQYAVAEKDWSGWYNNRDSKGVNVLMGTNPDGTDIKPMPTPLQRIGLLDALIIEAYDQYFFDNWAGLMPQVKAAYPNLPIILNVDHVCSEEGWQNGIPPNGNPYETGSDYGWWAPQGLGEPRNRCYIEWLWALQRIHYLEELNGKPFDGMIYNTYHPVFPVNGYGNPDITWFLQAADQLFVTNPIQTPHINASLDGTGTPSLNFGLAKDGSNSSVWLNLLLYSGGKVTSLPNATVNFSVVGIPKTTVDNTIFFSQPHVVAGDYGTPATLDQPGFIIRIFPEDISGLAAASYNYTLVVTTTSYGVETFNGVMVVT